MAVMDILKQKKWTDSALQKQGFEFYERKKTVVLARELQAEESPKRIKTTWDTLVAHTGFMICYDASDNVVRGSLDAYNHWPVEPRIFVKTYRKWDTTLWRPNRAEKHLMELGCKPYFKHAGIWAKRLKQPQWIQSLESIEPILVPKDGWIAIGIEGEPMSMAEREFRSRYRRPRSTNKSR
jgi:hypothetical protein